MADYKEVMRTLMKERDAEMECALKSRYLMKKQWNPIERIKCYKASKMFEEHSIGISIAIAKLKRKFGEP